MDPELMTAFSDLDLNGDGFLSMNELKQGFEKYGQKWDEAEEERYKKMDENGDGKVSLEGNFFFFKFFFNFFFSSQFHSQFFKILFPFFALFSSFFPFRLKMQQKVSIFF